MANQSTKPLVQETRGVRGLLRKYWHPKPIEPPKPDPNLEKLNGVARAAEVIRFSVLSIEFWISPNGHVREWLKKNTLLAVILAIPAFLVLPIITFALWQFVSWAMALTTIAGKLIVLPLLVLAATAVIAATVLLLKAVFSR